MPSRGPGVRASPLAIGSGRQDVKQNPSALAVATVALRTVPDLFFVLVAAQ
jgi:hypothetical protein